MVITIPSSSSAGLAPDRLICSMVSSIEPRPSSEKNSHWIGIKIVSAAAMAFIIRTPTEGGQSMRMYSNKPQFLSGCIANCSRWR